MNDIQKWWLSTYSMTVVVMVDANREITDASPIVKKFIGQPLQNLSKWMHKQGGLQMKMLESGQDTHIRDIL